MTKIASSSRRVSVYNSRKYLFICILAVLSLLGIGGGVRAQDYCYVFYNSSNGVYLCVNNGSLDVTSTFSPDNCIWQASGTLGNTSRSVHSYTSDYSSLYLYVGDYNNGGVTLLSSEQERWRLNNEYLYYYYKPNKKTYRHYIITDGSSVSTSTNSSTSGFKAYAVTITSYDETITNPTITGSSTIALNTTSEDYDASGAAYQRGYTNYFFTIGSTTYNYYYDDNGSSFTGTPSASTISGYTWSLSNTDYVSVNSEGLVTVTNRPTVDTEVTLYATATVTGGVPAAPANTTLIAQKTITILGTTPNPPTITASGMTITITPSNNSDDIYYTTDGTDPTSSSTPYDAPFTISETTTIKAIACRNSHCSSPSTLVVSLSSGVSGGVVTLYDYEDHNWSYYLPKLPAPDATADNPICSPYPRNVCIKYHGMGENTVADADGDFTEDANKVQVSYNEVDSVFVYYKTLERYSTDIGRYAYATIPNPFSVRPTYGSGDSRWRGFYKWRVKSIMGGKIYTAATGGTEIQANGTIDAEDVIYFQPTDNNYSNANNATSMTVELEALWAQAYVSVGTSELSDYVTGTNAYERNFHVVNANTDASNFQKSYPCTVSGLYPNGTTNGGTTLATEIPSTYIYYDFTAAADTKFEYLTMRNSHYTTDWWGNRTLQDDGGVYTADNHYLILGRGLSPYNINYGCAMMVRGLTAGRTEWGYIYYSTYSSADYKMRIESGVYSLFSLMCGTDSYDGYAEVSGLLTMKHTLGCDYDRASNNITNLKITNGVYYGNRNVIDDANQQRQTAVLTVKSGDILSGVTVSDASAAQSIYMSVANEYTYVGKRKLIIEGGQIACIAGGIDSSCVATDTTFMIRMTGGTVRGSIYGGAAFAATKGHRKYVITGGTIEGWIAGGANGTTTNLTGNNMGVLPSNTYIYIGGDAIVGTSAYTTQINTIEGGNIFGAGNGGTYSSSRPNSGQVNYATVVIADDCYVERDVYGGGNQGHTLYTANVYITGGTVNGAVFGGSNKNSGTNTIIKMYDGTVKEGIYGGSNSSGAISEDSKIYVYGGTVGVSDSDRGSVFGGGKGNATRVIGNVDVTVGKDCTHGPLIWGDVYGGSEQGLVNTASASTTANNASYQSDKHTIVGVTGGTIHGDVYGGGFGTITNAAHVCGDVTVHITGGTMNNVFGCNNANGQPKGPSIVTINYDEGCGTTSCGNSVNYAIKEAVYGGGRGAAYDYTNGTVVNFQNGSASAVYGGGLGANASVKKTTVTMTGGTVGNVFGGGNAGPVGTEGTAASVVSTTVSVLNGTVCNNVYGGGNAATVNGSTRVNIGEECISN